MKISANRRQFIIAGCSVLSVNAVAAGKLSAAKFPSNCLDLTSKGMATGERLSIDCLITDRSGRVVPNAFLEIEQANTFGVTNAPNLSGGKYDDQFAYWARGQANSEGWIRILTVRPGVTEQNVRSPKIAYSRSLKLHAFNLGEFSFEHEIDSSILKGDSKIILSPSRYEIR